MRNVPRFIAAALFFAVSLTAADDSLWKPLEFLIGDWTGEGKGEPGQGSGGFNLQLELQRKILVRKNRANYPATKERPAFSHEDWMVIYPDANGLRADYFDNEGHVIHYLVTPSPDQTGVEFSSLPSQGSPSYRLTYTKAGADRVKIKFEVAPPGTPSKFTTYIDATATRIAPKAPSTLVAPIPVK